MCSSPKNVVIANKHSVKYGKFCIIGNADLKTNQCTLFI